MQARKIVLIVRDIQRAKEQRHRHPSHATFREVKARCVDVTDEQLEALLESAVRGEALRRVRTINQYAYTIS